MTSKGFTDQQTSIETPNDANVAEKPLNGYKTNTQRVDINILKSKLQESESKEFKKNITILAFLILSLVVFGIYLSL